MQSTRGRGRPTQVDQDIVIDKVIDSLEILLQLRKIVSKSARVWDEISRELSNKITASSLHFMVCNNKYQLREKISHASIKNNSVASELESINDSRASCKNDTLSADEHEGVSRTYMIIMPRDSFQALAERKKYKRANKSYRMTTVLIAGVWEDIVMDEIVKQTPVTCGYNFHNHYISNDLKSGYINGPSKCLFEKTYFELMSTALKPGGIVCSQAGTAWANLDHVAKTLEHCRSAFAVASYYTVSVPTYPTGQIGFVIGSKNLDTNFKEPLRTFNEEELDDMKIRYYSAEMHRAAFVLPRFIAKALRSTEDEPKLSKLTN